MRLQNIHIRFTNIQNEQVTWILIEYVVKYWAMFFSVPLADLQQIIVLNSKPILSN